MKKTVIILILILVAIYMLLAVISKNDDYAAEKLFYQAMRVNEKIILNPDVAPEGMLLAVEEPLQQILKKYSNASMIKDVHLSLAEFYLVHKKYAQAIATTSEIIAKYSEAEPILASKAYFIKGSAYEKQEKWPEALAEYTALRDKYPRTPMGLAISLYIGEYYKRDKRYAKSEQAYKNAIVFYEKFIQENKQTQAGYTAVNFLLACHMELKQWEEAAIVLEQTINDYPQVQALVQQLPRIELIFIKKLNKPNKARQLYVQIKDKVNNPQIEAFIDEKIKELEAKNRR